MHLTNSENQPAVAASPATPSPIEFDEIDGIINPLEIVRISWEGVMRNKVRSLLTMLGVIIGVAAVIIMISISAGTEAQIASQIEGLGTNLVFIQAPFGRGAAGGDTVSLIYDDTEIIENVPGVIGTVVEQGSNVTIEYEGTTLTEVSLIGTTPDFPSVRAVDISDGRFFNETELDRTAKVAVLGSTLAADLFGQTDPIGQSIRIDNTRLTIVGVAAPKGVVGNVDFDAQLYTPITVAFERFVPTRFARIVGNRVRIVYAQIDETRDMDTVIEQIQLKLALEKEVPADELPFTMRTQQDIIETQGAATAAFRSLLAWVAAVSLLVGGIGIMNIMLVSVTERTREIGIRQSVGATPNDIRLQFLTESLMLSTVGGLVGILFGIGGAILFGISGDMPTVIVPSSIALAFFSAAAVGIFFGFFPANQAAKLDPIQALRHE